jgi:F-type H+-transporting ATPase subunit a
MSYIGEIVEVGHEYKEHPEEFAKKKKEKKSKKKAKTVTADAVA